MCDNHIIRKRLQGSCEVILNSEMEYDGAWEIPLPLLKASAEPAQQKEHSIQLIVPAMSRVVIKPKRKS